MHVHRIADYKVGGLQQTIENRPPEFMNNTQYPKSLIYDLLKIHINAKKN